MHEPYTPPNPSPSPTRLGDPVMDACEVDAAAATRLLMTDTSAREGAVQALGESRYLDCARAPMLTRKRPS
jgi:hypothetical protein